MENSLEPYNSYLLDPEQIQFHDNPLTDYAQCQEFLFNNWKLNN